MADEEQQRTETFLETQQGFIGNAFKILQQMIDWSNVTPNSKHLVDEILHSIFFLGKINNPSFPPEEIIGDKHILEALKDKYPRPFQFYDKQLPRRSPFSCVLDMIVLQKGQDHEDQIMQTLEEFVSHLNPRFLVSSTICISQNSPNSKRYYGVSMSTTGPNPGRIVIAASCFSKWDEYVSGAVMTYYPKKVKKEYFDGTIQVPQYVRCRAFILSKGTGLPPCRSCRNLFGLNTEETKEWAYGNCAEAESLSNLLKNEEEVKKGTHVHEHSAEGSRRAKEEVLKELNNVLRMIHFNTWTGDYYSPESV
ncbi:uncharacterized protein LOC115788610 [Archocentrus centrarchus]|uniref:uncharacterized protein LOC115788610 n=1 Tax=Archocentrus centrarchus TaxID=63155 RepID=UPI0011EA3282|nr:uncharacterized protein LOC115788610 [Archocentrus centrarchus]